MNGRRFPFGKTGRMKVETKPLPAPVQQTVELSGFTAPEKVLPFVEARAGETPAVRPPEPSATRATRRRSALWIAIAIAVVVFDVIAAWLILRRPS